MADEDLINFDKSELKMPGVTFASHQSAKPSSPVADPSTPLKTRSELFSDLVSQRTSSIGSCDSLNFLSSTQEEQTQTLMNSLESWRELIAPIYSVLLWEKSYHPGAIIGCNTFLFLCLWLLDPSILTTVSIFGLTLTVCDYFVPIVTAMVFKPDMWTESKQKVYYEFCNAMVIYKEKIAVSWASFYVMRFTKPKHFYLWSIINLAIFAWIGNTINNMFLLYVFTTCLLLTPGAERHGLLYRFGLLARQKVLEITKLKLLKKDE